MSAPALTLRARRLGAARSLAVRIRPGAVAAAVPLMLLAIFVGTNVQSGLAQQRLAARWDAARAAAAGLTPVQLSGVEPAPGEPVARLSIPAIRLDAIVVEGAGPEHMRAGPAHLPGTALPGDEGTSVIGGNRLGFGGFFAALDRLGPGDRIDVETLSGAVRYVVTAGTVVSASQLDTAPSAGRSLVLYGSARRWGGGDRLVVRAEAAP